MTRRALFLIPAVVFASPSVTFASSSVPLQRACALRSKLRKMGVYDNIREDWQEVLDAIHEGCVEFIASPSRMLCTTHSGRVLQGCGTDPTQTLLYRVLPIRWVGETVEQWVTVRHGERK